MKAKKLDIIANLSYKGVINLNHNNEDKIVSIGRVQGKLISVLPKGLFIPEQALEVEISDFEGPLDLLLYLTFPSLAYLLL